jgi:hypothetical protein
LLSVNEPSIDQSTRYLQVCSVYCIASVAAIGH